MANLKQGFQHGIRTYALILVHYDRVFGFEPGFDSYICHFLAV